MKNSKIHFGLENSGLRDFLSISMVKNYEQEFSNKETIILYSANNENGLQNAINSCENDIAYLNKKLEILKQRQSISSLINMQGWKEFDVSNETEKDLDYTLRIKFIGTQSEYDDLILQIENESK